MADPEAPSREPSAHAVLALPKSASGQRLERAARRLRTHLDKKIREAPDAAIAAGRQAERDGFELAMDRLRPARSGQLRRLGPWLLGLGWVIAVLGGIAWIGQTVSLRPSPASQAAPPPLAGQISVLADPADSELLVFDETGQEILLRATANGQWQTLGPGSYHLRVQRQGCPDRWEQSTHLEGNDRRAFAPLICAGTASLTVTSSAASARLRIDDYDVGAPGPEARTLRVGVHEIQIDHPDHQPWRGQVLLKADETVRVAAELVPLHPPAATAPASAGGPPPLPDPVASSEGPETSPTSDTKRERTGSGGSKNWHNAIREQLVSNYDTNGTRSLDTPDEVQSIPCSVWTNVEASYETGGLSVAMSHLYGFDGSRAPANTLGITQAMRGYAFDRMKTCGLRVNR